MLASIRNNVGSSASNAAVLIRFPSHVHQLAQKPENKVVILSDADMKVGSEDPLNIILSIAWLVTEEKYSSASREPSLTKV